MSTPPLPVILEMHQAGKGDLLRIVGGGQSIIIDSGTADRSERLRRLLAEMPCELLVLTHLDADHFGGLQQLVQEHFDGKANEVRWPAEIVVNDFEPREAVESVRAVVGADDPINLDSLIAQAREWQAAGRESTSVVTSTRERRPCHRHGRLRRSSKRMTRHSSISLHHLRNNRDDGLSKTHTSLRTFDKLSHEYGDEAAHRHGSSVRRGWFFREGGNAYRQNERVFLLDSGAVLVTRRSQTRRPGISVFINDPSLVDGTEGTIPAGLPPPVRGLLHLAQEGPQILESVKLASETMTLIEALRKIVGKDKVTFAQVEKRPRISALHDALMLHVVGPDEPELRGLREKWREIRERGQIHVGMRHTAFLEATFFAADAGRFRMDTSVTNRSSIQLIADTALGRAVLTGDGRPDTLDRVVETLSSLPSRRCLVFKAAHHGSDHNIDLRQDPNKILNRFQPKQIWVSGGDKFHPAREFLRYLHEQRQHVPFEIAVTNANENVRAMQPRLPIRLMEDDAPFTCDLNSPA